MFRERRIARKVSKVSTPEADAVPQSVRLGVSGSNFTALFSKKTGILVSRSVHMLTT